MILESPQIPLIRKTLIDEELVLDQLDEIQINLPSAFAKALDVIRQQEDILLEAEAYAQEIIDKAEQVAAQMLNETGIIQQAEQQSAQLRQQVQQDCQQLQQSTLAEVQEIRKQASEELDKMRQIAFAECRDIENGADDYADAVLTNIEDQLVTMLRVIRNGRKQLETEIQPQQPLENHHSD